MAIIKATKENGENITSVIPDEVIKNEVEELCKRGYKDIHNAETGEKYN